MQVFVILFVILLSVHVGSLAAAPVHVESVQDPHPLPRPQAGTENPSSSSLPASLPLNAEGVVDGPSPSPPQLPRLCDGQPLLGEAQIREIVEELMQQNRLPYDEEDQTPTRTK